MRKWGNHSRTVALFWAFSFSIFFLLLRLMAQNYSSLVANSPGYMMREITDLQQVLTQFFHKDRKFLKPKGSSDRPQVGDSATLTNVDHSTSPDLQQVLTQFFYKDRKFLKPKGSSDRPQVGDFATLTNTDHSPLPGVKYPIGCEERYCMAKWRRIWMNMGQCSSNMGKLQSLSLSELFTLVNGVVTPVLKAANPPVRANVLYLNPTYSKPLAIRACIILACPTLLIIYLLFLPEIEAEAEDVKAVTQEICPLRVVFDKVVLASTGVLLGCWQTQSQSEQN